MVMVLIFLVSCGGSSGGNGSGGEEGSGEPVAMDISTNGGSVELPGVATVEFPEGAFENDTNVTLKESEVSETVIQMLDTLPTEYITGQPYKYVIDILTPVQPKKEITIKYTVPDEFVQQLDAQNEPVLIARYVQSGADEEKMDDFEDIKAILSDNVLTAKLPPWVFSNDYPDTNGVFRTTIVLGSNPKEVTETSSSSKSFFLKSESSCSGSKIGSPLEKNLEVTSPFGNRINGETKTEEGHKGTDFRADTGDNVLAVENGTVETIRYNYNTETKRGYGYYVVLLHPDGSKTRYAHLEKGSADNLKVGDKVEMGNVIGKADTSGGARGPHLHFEYEVGGTKIDPQPCIGTAPIEIKEVVYGDKIVAKQLKASIQFEIHLNIPSGNDISNMTCVGIDDSTGTCQYLTRMDFVTIDGIIRLKEPRGSWSGQVKIIDRFQNNITAPINVLWDCCDIPNQSHWPIYSNDGKLIAEVPFYCYFLGDKTNQCE